MWQGATVPVSPLSSSCKAKLESPETYPIEASLWECESSLELQAFSRIFGERSLRNMDLGRLRRWKGSIEIENRKIECVHFETQSDLIMQCNCEYCSTWYVECNSILRLLLESANDLRSILFCNENSLHRSQMYLAWWKYHTALSYNTLNMRWLSSCFVGKVIYFSHPDVLSCKIPTWWLMLVYARSI